MSNLLADDHLLTLLGATIPLFRATSRLHPKVAERVKRIGHMMRKSELDETSILKRYFDLVRKHYHSEHCAQVLTSHPVRLTPDPLITGNYGVWAVLSKLIKHRARILVKEKHTWNRVRSQVENSIMSTGYRSMKGGLVNNTLISSLTDRIDHISLLPTLEAVLSEKMKEARSRFNRKFNAWKSSGFEESSVPANYFLKSEEYLVDGLPKEQALRVVSFGPLMVIRVCKSTFVLPEAHTHKLLSLIKSWTTILIGITGMSYRYQPLDFLEDFMRSHWGIIEDDTDFLGEVIKGARGLAVASFDTSKIIGVDMFRSTADAMKPSRRALALESLSFFKSCFSDKADVVNALNLYKAVPHPDTNLQEAFGTIGGLSEPNRIDPSMLPRFRGTLRRAIYRSLATSSADVRLISIGQAANGLVEEANKTQRSIAQVCEKSSLAWANTKFQPVRSVTKPSEIILTASDKSSQAAPEFSEQDLLDSELWASGEGPERQPDFSRQAHTLNDAAEFLKGNNKFNVNTAIKRFQKVVNMHTAFEARYPGLSPEEIPEEDLRKFVLETPSARYLVGTEPKLGEYHKKVTRIFYMAESDLKLITQITERVARQISRKQNGVSIVKGYSGRRRDLEQFASSVTGPDAEKQSIFVSFDMSEFSKKFPMALVREYGEVLSEITGEEWMRRIDLVFRAAVVIHNTRGYFNWTSGVKGGFEGFLNFVWSSIHAAVMEVALRSTGLSGMILTYSDDGLLLFYSPVQLDVTDNYRKVMSIKDTYYRHGLVFHLGKTMISSEVWEYLGDMCFRGHLLPMWMKEVSSIGVLKTSRGLNPLRMRISSIEGQVAAAVSSGMNPLLAYTALRFWASNHLSNFTLCDDNRLIESLLIIPVSLGGSRIRSAPELSIGGDIDVLSEFIADLECLMEFDPNLSRSITSHISTVISGVKPSPSRIAMGTLLSSNLPDTSGMSIITSAIDLIKDSVPDSVRRSVGGHPITTAVNLELAPIFLAVTNLDHRAVSRLLMSLPAWSRYTKSMALVRGSGAIRLISRRDLRRMQSSDTKNCRAAFAEWRKLINGPAGRVGTPYDSVVHAIERCNRGYSLKPLKLSGRSLLSLDRGAGPVITQVRYHPEPMKPPQSMSYKEPRVHFPQESSTLHWFSEATGDVEISAARKFQDLCASFLSFSPESLPFLRAIGNVFGTSIPYIPPGILRGFHRRSSQVSSPVDVRLAMPKPFWSLSEVAYVGEANQRVRGAGRADRVTYLEYSRVLAYMNSFKHDRLGSYPSDAVIVYSFHGVVDELAANCELHDMRVGPEAIIPVPDIDEDERTQREFMAVINEGLVVSENRDMLERVTWNVDQDDLEDLTAIYTISINALTRWIHDAIMNRSTPILPLRALPTAPIMRSLVFKKSIVNAAWATITPSTRGLAGSALRQYAEIRMGGPVNLSADARNAVAAFGAHLDRVINTLYDLGHGILNAAELDKVRAETRSILDIISECVLSSQIFTGDRVVVVRSSSAHPGYMTESHRVAFRKVFSASITALSNSMATAAWRTDVVPVLAGMGLNPDDVMDWLVICRPLLRASSHRTMHHPYNRTSAIISMMKFYLALRMCFGPNGCRNTDYISWARQFRPTAPMRNAIRRELERSGRVLGPDHLQILESGIDETVINRFGQHARGIRNGDKYGTYNNSSARALREFLDPLLTAVYERLILRAVNSVIEVPSSFASRVEDLPDLPAFGDALLSGVRATMDFFSGLQLPSEAMDRAIPVRQLVSAHIANYCVKSGTSGLSLYNGAPAWLRTVLRSSGYEEPEGPTLVPAGVSGGSGVMFCCRRYNTAEAAFASMITFTRQGIHSASLIRNPRDTKYYLVGVASHRELVNMQEDSETLEVVSEAPVDSFIPRVSFDAEVTSTSQAYMMLTRRGGPPVTYGLFNQAVAAHAREMNAPNELNNESIFLQTAVDIAHDDRSSNGRLWSYTLFAQYLRGMEDMERAKLTYRQLRAVLSRADHPQRGALILDISNVTTWLSHVNLFPGDDIPFVQIERLIAERPDLVVPVTIGPSITFHRVMNFTQIRALIAAGTTQFAPGRIMGELILVEQLMIMGDDLGEDDDIDGGNVDLDNFW